MVESTNDKTNPFDIEAPALTDDMTQASYDAVIQPLAETAEVDTTGAMQDQFSDLTTPYEATTLSTDNVGYDPSQAKGFDYNVTGNQTVQDQLQGIIAAESPLMQQAQTRALQDMNQRGLLNSSMAIGAGQSALYDAALPIAQQDAKTFAEGEQVKAELNNQIEMFNVNAQNRALEFEQAMKQEGGLANMAALNRSEEFNLSNLGDVFKFLYGVDADLSKFNAKQRQDANMYVADTANTFTKQQLQNTFEARIASADAQTKTTLQSIDSTTRTTLATIESDYKQLMQTTSSASDLFQQTLANINSAALDPDMSTEALQSYTKQTLDQLALGMQVFSFLNPVIEGLETLITFEPEEAA
nr:hypothetical protein 6 [Burkholderiaceae bacterium]